MARRRNPDDILGARGYNARVLWPRYTPGGGVNSGSEPPIRPSNTLQSNQSNLILTTNPRDSAAYARRNSRNGSSGYSDYVELRPVSGRTNPSTDGKIAVTTKAGETKYVTQAQYDAFYAKSDSAPGSGSGSTPTQKKQTPFQRALAHAISRGKRNPYAPEEELLREYEAHFGKDDDGWRAEKSAVKQKSTTKKSATKASAWSDFAARVAKRKATKDNPKREIGDSMQARRKSKSCSGALINPGDSITKTAAGWERTDLL